MMQRGIQAAQGEMISEVIQYAFAVVVWAFLPAPHRGCLVYWPPKLSSKHLCVNSLSNCDSPTRKGGAHLMIILTFHNHRGAGHGPNQFAFSRYQRLQ